MNELAVLGLLIGSVLIVSQVAGLIRAVLARRWKRTEGCITQSHMAADTYLPASLRHVSAVVTYEYSVDGSVYTGRRISHTGHGLKNSNSGAARQAVGDFSVGRRVEVWYDPNRPSRAVLIREFGVASPLICATGVVLVAFAVKALNA